ncbi:MAG: radical SAM family heme chaperone HemW [Clostridia bacterium]
MEVKEIGLYVHIPFCKQKCYYCDFISYANKEQMVEKYINCLKKEIIQYATENKIMAAHKLEPEYIIKTIYIGGGTPSFIDEAYILSIVKTIKENFKLKENAEITIEVNPGTANKDKLEAFKSCGINRLSIGLQAIQDEILKKIGRIHTYQDFLNTYEYARQAGFDNINVDLMIGLPDQTLENVKENIKAILSLKPDHISVYSLILEEGTKLNELIKTRQLELISDELEREMYWYVKETLEKHKYNQYEISNFAKSGFESKHNLDCWNQNEYLGVGAAASSFIEDKRYSNTSELEQYIANIENNTPNMNLQLEETLTNESKMEEYMMLGLRKIEGVNIAEFERKFNKNPIVKYSTILEKLNHEGLIEVNGSNIRLTNKGINLANLVWEEFI